MNNSMEHDSFAGNRVGKIRWIMDHAALDGDGASVMLALVELDDRLKRVETMLIKIDPEYALENRVGCEVRAVTPFDNCGGRE